MKNPLISIIVPNYNHEDFLKNRLESIYNQTFRDFEVILLDDCSVDGSDAIFKKYAYHPKTSYYEVNNKNSGSPFIQWNKGIALSKGEFIWIAESDDTSDISFLDRMIKPLQADANVALAFSQSSRMDGDGHITGNWIDHTNQTQGNLFENDFTLPGYLFIERYLIHKNVIPNVSAVLFRSKNLKDIMPLEQKYYLRYSADWFYYIQILKNADVSFISESLNNFRYHSNSVISRAGGESGWRKIAEMEIMGRKAMLNQVRSTKPENLENIEIQSALGDKKLVWLTFKALLKIGNYKDGFKIVLGHPKLIGAISKNLYEEFKIKLNKEWT